jgi:hypothetical protein
MKEARHKRIRQQTPYIYWTPLEMALAENSSSGLGTVAHTYNPSHLGGRDRRIALQVWPGQKVSKNFSQKQARLGDTCL